MAHPDQRLNLVQKQNRDARARSHNVTRIGARVRQSELRYRGWRECPRNAKVIRDVPHRPQSGCSVDARGPLSLIGPNAGEVDLFITSPSGPYRSYGLHCVRTSFSCLAAQSFWRSGVVFPNESHAFQRGGGSVTKSTFVRFDPLLRAKPPHPGRREVHRIFLSELPCPDRSKTRRPLT